jgi:hypothetical protein
MFAGYESDRSWLARAAMPVALAFFVVITLALASQFVTPYPVDFISYWAAGSLALDGNPAGAYDHGVHRAVEEQGVAMRGGMPFPYPPPFLIVAAPLALLPYVWSLLAWVLISFAFYLVAVRKVAPRAGWLPAAFPPVMTNAIIGQNGFLSCGIMAAGLALLPKRPWLSGFVLGLLILKPQLGLALPFVLVAGREWRAFGGAAAGAGGLLLAGAALFGIQPYLDWFSQAPLYASIVTEGLTRWGEMASVYASSRLAGFEHATGLALHLAIAVAAIGTACAVWLRTAEIGPRAASLAAATALASPYFYGYDSILLVIPFVWLAESPRDRAPLAFVWALSLAAFLQIWAGDFSVNVAPLVALLLLALVGRRVFQRGGVAQPLTCTISKRSAVLPSGPA